MFPQLTDRAKIFTTVSCLTIGTMLFCAADGFGPSVVRASCGDQTCPPGTICCGTECLYPPMQCCGDVPYDPEEACCMP